MVKALARGIAVAVRAASNGSWIFLKVTMTREELERRIAVREFQQRFIQSVAFGADMGCCCRMRVVSHGIHRIESEKVL